METDTHTSGTNGTPVPGAADEQVEVREPEPKPRGCWWWGTWSLVALIGLMVVSALVAAAYTTITTNRIMGHTLPPGQRVDVGGHRLHLYCTGEGNPTVVIEAGKGGWSLDWALVQPGVAQFTQVCTYDRAGYGFSDPGPLPRTGAQITSELHALLEGAGVGGPYVLVGHSLGGVYARLYVSRYPNQVAGLVLVDALHKDFEDRLPAEYSRYADRSGRITRAVLWTTSRLGIRWTPPLLQRLPEEVRPAYRAVIAQAKHGEATAAEEAGKAESLVMLREAGPLGDMPLLVLTHGRPSPAPPGPGLPAEVLAQVDELWQACQRELVDLSTEGRQIIAEESGHDIHVDQPELVVEAIHELVDAIRSDEG